MKPRAWRHARGFCFLRRRRHTQKNGDRAVAANEDFKGNAHQPHACMSRGDTIERGVADARVGGIASAMLAGALFLSGACKAGP